jgi:hypothetical protein
MNFLRTLIGRESRAKTPYQMLVTLPYEDNRRPSSFRARDRVA